MLETAWRFFLENFFSEKLNELNRYHP